MYKLFSKWGLVAGAGLGIVVLTIFILSAIGEGVTGLTDADLLNDSFFTFTWGIGITQFLLVAAIIITFGFGIYQLILDPASGFKLLIGLVAILVIFVLSILFFGGESSAAVKELLVDFKISSGSDKVITGIVGSGLMLFVLAIFATIGLEVFTKFFRKN